MKRSIVIALALCMALCLAGCGSAGGKSAAGSAGAAASAASASASAGAGAAGDAQSLQSENEQLKAENERLKSQLSAAQNVGGADPEQDNPIDTLFSQYDQEETTAGMLTVASAEYTAWHDELTAFVKDMETQTEDAADKKDLENYLKNAETQAQVLTQMVYMTSAGSDVPRSEREGSSGTLAPVQIASGGAQVFKNAFYGLYNVRYVAEADWTWHFDSAAAKQALDTQLAAG